MRNGGALGANDIPTRLIKFWWRRLNIKLPSWHNVSISSAVDPSFSVLTRTWNNPLRASLIDCGFIFLLPLEKFFFWCLKSNGRCCLRLTDKCIVNKQEIIKLTSDKKAITKNPPSLRKRYCFCHHRSKSINKSIEGVFKIARSEMLIHPYCKGSNEIDKNSKFCCLENRSI